MTASMTVRRATATDAAELARLSETTFSQTFGHLYPPEDLADYVSRVCTPRAYLEVIQDPKAGVWVAGPDQGPLAGYVVAAGCKLPVENLEPNAGEIRQLYVLSSYQKAKLGSKLLDAALDWLIAQKRTPIYIGVWSENHGAQRFYGRYGFVKVGEYGFPVGKTVDHEFILKR